MHLTANEAQQFANKLRINLLDTHGVSIIICPPFLGLKSVFDTVKDSSIKVGAQNMHNETQGAFTGEISGEMIKDIGIQYVLLGHSERRHVFGETDDFINKKMASSLRVGLDPVLCVGERLEEREAGKTSEVVIRQLRAGLKEISEAQMAHVMIAYEPVWAIGTGLTASREQAVEVHEIIRDELASLYSGVIAEKTAILYGGSVKAENAKDLMSHEEIDGVLVGGAALKVDSFVGIAKAAMEIN